MVMLQIPEASNPTEGEAMFLHEIAFERLPGEHSAAVDALETIVAADIMEMLRPDRHLIGETHLIASAALADGYAALQIARGLEVFASTTGTHVSVMFKLLDRSDHIWEMRVERFITP